MPLFRFNFLVRITCCAYEKMVEGIFIGTGLSARGTVFLLLLMTVLMGINLSIQPACATNEPVSDPEFLALAARFAADTVQNESGYDEREERTFARIGSFPRGHSTKIQPARRGIQPQRLIPSGVGTVGFECGSSPIRKTV